MKRVMVIVMVGFVILLSSCTRSSQSNEYNALNDCIDAMVEAESTEACDEETRQEVHVDFALMEYLADLDITLSANFADTETVPQEDRLLHALRYIEGTTSYSPMIQYEVHIDFLNNTDILDIYDSLDDMLFQMTEDVQSMTDVDVSSEYRITVENNTVDGASIELDDEHDDTWVILGHRQDYQVLFQLRKTSDMLTEYPIYEEILTRALSNPSYTTVIYSLYTADYTLHLHFYNESMSYTISIDKTSEDVVTDTSFADVGELVDATIEGLGYTLIEQ